MKNMDQDTRLLIEALRQSFPAPPRRGFDSWSVPPLNVLDCVLSLNRKYDTFCRPRVQQFANQHPGVDTLARLLRLINEYSTPLQFSIEELNYRDEQRAATLVDVLTYLLQAQKAFRGLKWTPLSRPFFARNKLIPGGVLGLSFGGGYGSPPPAIPALESALGSHPCGALSSVRVPSL